MDSRPLPLTATEYKILELLIRRSPAVVDRKAIAEHAWHDETDPLGSNAIDVQISRLRAKLPAPASASSPSAAPAIGWRKRDRPRRHVRDVRTASIRVALAATAVVAIAYLAIVASPSS